MASQTPATGRPHLTLVGTHGSGTIGYPEADRAGRTPREQGRPVGSTRCGCPLATWTERWSPTLRRCNGCGAPVTHSEEQLRQIARHAAHTAHELSRAAA